MLSLFLSFALSVAILPQTAPAVDYSRLAVLGEDWVAAARADKLSTSEVTVVLELAQTWKASNRENEFDPYVRKLNAFYVRSAQDPAKLRPIVHGAACWHSRKVAAAKTVDPGKGRIVEPPSFLWNWISPRNPARCPG
ncbi:hypothetical protein [Sphingomonas sp. M1-B02]|uniref:hypothetical protein n=1 Tax=Sphingomonas sp. M1-B02 TaxID=3114300 RepID=UPI00223FB66D|nr:hypothetical protein [Sphingomonas sp. S6-11]UZK67800.1 hypothetical protein OKW87_08230 [Sphingomonas sp. S6-11]